MTRAEKVARARELRAQGLLLREIAAEMGVSKQTILRWTDPGYAERSLATSRAWKARNREANRARDRAFQKGRACERCGAPTRGHVCRFCVGRRTVERALAIMRLRNVDDLSTAEIARHLDLPYQRVAQTITHLRVLGFDVAMAPYGRRMGREPAARALTDEALSLGCTLAAHGVPVPALDGERTAG